MLERRRWTKVGCSSIRRAAMSHILPLATVFVLIIAASLPAAGPPAGWRERALTFADYEHMFGLLNQTDTGYEGSFVSFQFNESTVRITDYTVLTPSRSTSIFQTIVPAQTAAGTSSVNGSIFRFVSSAMEITVCNNPTSAFSISSTATAFDVTMMLSPGLSARRNGQSLNISSSDISARLFVTGTATLSLSGADATAHLPQGTRVMFRVDSTAGEDVAGNSGQQSLGNASVTNQLVLESFGIGLEGFIEMSDVEYGGFADLGADATASGLEIDFEGDSPSRLVALHLHYSAIASNNRTGISVSLDGQSISKLSTLDEVVSYGGGASVYSYITGSGGLLLLVFIPSQGGHILKVDRADSTEAQGLNPIQIAAIVAVVLVLLGIAAAIMIRRRPPR